MKPSVKQLTEHATDVLRNAYAPYSRFKVAAALSDEYGRIFTGVNVENASYGGTMCAERSAVFSAVTNGANKIREIVIVTPTTTPTAPCGFCRQVLNEFTGGNLKVTSVALKSGRKKSWTLKKLLPDAFGPKNLK